MKLSELKNQKKPVKLLFAGNSGTGKTGALTSLVDAGYKLRIVDFDAGLDALIHHVNAQCPDKLENIEVNSFRDRMKFTKLGPRIEGTARAYIEALRALEKWPDDGSKPEEWGTDYILVVDSLTNAGRAAFKWAEMQMPNARDPRQLYKLAQDMIEDMIANLTDEAFNTNVIVISHLTRLSPAGAGDGHVISKEVVSSIGTALGDKLPRFFNTFVLAETSVMGKKVKRTIKTFPTPTIDLKNPRPMDIDEIYPLETGLAQIFKKLH
ncbi:hypothetical protein D6827_01670 [Candidatus Parcubacteria bacterium]|nr:MAG: hypothetical protein D6827_01670 [Candidatus Parcubacteria bacterium]